METLETYTMMFPNFTADIRRYLRNSRRQDRIYLFFEQGIWALAVYRFGRWAQALKFPLISHLLRLEVFLLFKWIEMTTGISLPASAQIGRGLYVGHFGGIILHSDVVMGENCSIGPGVVIGTRGLGDSGVPVIGDGVYIGTGAKVLGAIRVGNHARVGANSVVIDDVPEGATVVGVPARVQSKPRKEAR